MYHATLSSKSLADNTSIRPSASRSAANTERAPLAAVVMVYAVQVSGLPPPFLYHATLSSLLLADSTSKRPSASRSAANTECAPPAAAEMVYAVQVSGLPPPFLYHAILLSYALADSTSIRPSASRSAAYTERTQSAAVVMLYAVQVSGLPPPFLYHATLSLFSLADSTSMRPSASRSAANTEHAPSATVMLYAVQVSGLPPPFLYHATLSSMKLADSTSIRPSASRSAAYTEIA
jgi:hypothetical protein